MYFTKHRFDYLIRLLENKDYIVMNTRKDIIDFLSLYDSDSLLLKKQVCKDFPFFKLYDYSFVFENNESVVKDEFKTDVLNLLKKYKKEIVDKGYEELNPFLLKNNLMNPKFETILLSIDPSLSYPRPDHIIRVIPIEIRGKINETEFYEKMFEYSPDYKDFVVKKETRDYIELVKPVSDSIDKTNISSFYSLFF